MLFNEYFAQNFAKLKINLMISIDSPEKEDYETIRSGASFERLKEAVAMANKYKIFDSALVTIGRYNYQQIDKIFQLAKEMGCPKITFLGLKPCRDYERYFLKGEEYFDFFRSVIRNQKEHQIDVYVDEPFFQPLLLENGIEYSLNPESGIVVPDVSRCIFGEYLFIETNGDIKPCTFAPLVVGNVREKSIGAIWADMLSSELIEAIRDFSTRESPCRECSYLLTCGGCRARSFYLTRDWFASDPSCPLKGR
jgi:radical SAM protein with 4Fe4S-binding SPASM domain